MAWSWNNNSYGDWGGRPDWHGPNPAPSRGIDRAPDSTREWFGPDAPFPDAFFASPFGGPRAFGGPGDAPWWPFSRGGHGHGHRGSCSRRAHPERDQAGEGLSRDAQPADADPPTSTPDELNDTTTPGTAVPDEAHQARPPPYRHRPLPHHGPFSRGGPRGPRRGRGGRHPSPGRHHPELPPNPWASTLHSLANTIFPQTPGAAAQASDDEAPFTPPLDLFAAPSAYILHLALPGAKKSEVGVDWDPDTSTLRVAGVIHRPGDEALLSSLLPSSAERRVGYFERLIKLPPPEAAKQARRWRNRRPQGTRVGEKADGADWDEEEGREEVDGAAITAKMEDGVLIITVPKVEKGWTEVSSIDIE